MDFRAWLSEDYSSLVPGWRGEPEGLFEDPKRMHLDPKYWRDYYYRKEKAEKDLERAKKKAEEEPSSREAQKELGQALGAVLWSAVPTVPDPKPRGEYQGWTNWDTWAVALWANNERIHHETLRKYARMKNPIERFKKYVSRRKKSVDQIGAYKVDLDFVNWDEIIATFQEE